MLASSIRLLPLDRLLEPPARFRPACGVGRDNPVEMEPLGGGLGCEQPYGQPPAMHRTEAEVRWNDQARFPLRHSRSIPGRPR